MPKISEFYGISIYIYYRDHGPPHFHATYAGRRVSVCIEDLTVLEGRTTPRALRLIRAWARTRRTELLAVWDDARARRPLSWIEPLD